MSCFSFRSYLSALCKFWNKGGHAMDRRLQRPPSFFGSEGSKLEFSTTPPAFPPVWSSSPPLFSYPYPPPQHNAFTSLPNNYKLMPYQYSAMSYDHRLTLELSPYQNIQGKTYLDVSCQTSSEGDEKTSRTLRPPVRPEVTVNRSKRDPNGRRYPSFSLLCYNVLSQDLISENMYLYSNTPHDWLAWDYRKRRLIKELINSEADVLCLQEVHEDHYYDWYKRKLESHGYRGLYLKRTGDQKDGCAIFYDTHYLELVDENYVKYQKYKGCLSRDNVGLIARFRFRSSKSRKSSKSCKRREFLVATTHILFNPKAGEIKLAQICYLLAELHKMASTHERVEVDGNLPCILCGDFNCLPNSPFLQFLLEGRLDYTGLSATAIAGYVRYSGTKYRHIPMPVLHAGMGIGMNCQYMTQPATKSKDDTDTRCTPADKKPITDGITLSNGTDNASTPPALIDDHSSLPTSTTPTNKRVAGDEASGTPLQERKRNNSSFTNSRYPETSSDTGPPSYKRFCPLPTEKVESVLTHPFKFMSCYSLPRFGSKSPSVTTYHMSAAETVDYILCTSKDLSSGWSSGFHIVRREALPSFSTLERLGPQPNQVLSSDHLYLNAEIQLID